MSLPGLFQNVHLMVSNYTSSTHNAIRHAKASHAGVEFDCCNGEARLRVSDDGVGFDPGSALDGDAKSGWGLVGIRKRVQLAGGECHIESAPGKGTSVTVEIPLPLVKEKGNGAH